MPGAVRSFWLGLKLAVTYPALFFLMCYLEDHHHNLQKDLGFCLFIFIVQFFVALLCLAFDSPRQLRWYRWSFMLPVSVSWPLLLLSQALHSDDLKWIFLMTAVWVLPGAPLVWLLGALSIRCDDRRDRRLLGH